MLRENLQAREGNQVEPSGALFRGAGSLAVQAGWALLFRAVNRRGEIRRVR